MNYTLPEKFEEFADARKAGFLRVRDLKEQGKKVAGVFCTFTPTEILDAADFTYVSLCGMSPETIPNAEAHLPKNLCPLIKSSYGFAVSDKCPYTYFSDLIVGETTCDGKKKMYELLNRIEDPFLKEMTKEQRKTYSDCMEARLDIEIAEMRDAFVRGFRMGARLMLETLTEEAA
jgi:benzoyl-CoA reductase/2-hydroxyglutaryl-CoA dehydratase subunit BcrC/BadD/HgdB